MKEKKQYRYTKLSGSIHGSFCVCTLDEIICEIEKKKFSVSTLQMNMECKGKIIKGYNLINVLLQSHREQYQFF